MSVKNMISGNAPFNSAGVRPPRSGRGIGTPVFSSVGSPLLSTAGILLCSALIFAGCDFGEDDPPELQTRILDVQITPHPVPVGDTAAIYIVIEDSLDEGFQFSWQVDGEGPQFSEEPRIDWVANKDPGTYAALASAHNPEIDAITPSVGIAVSVSDTSQTNGSENTMNP